MLQVDNSEQNQARYHLSGILSSASRMASLRLEMEGEGDTTDLVGVLCCFVSTFRGRPCGFLKQGCLLATRPGSICLSPSGHVFMGSRVSRRNALYLFEPFGVRWTLTSQVCVACSISWQQVRQQDLFFGNQILVARPQVASAFLMTLPSAQGEGNV